MVVDEAFDGRDEPLVARATVLANRGYLGVHRRSAKDMDHPSAVADILRSAGCPEPLVAAGLLHDLLEDTS